MQGSFKEQNEQINRLTINMTEAVNTALECFRLTQSCLQHCLALGGKYAEEPHCSLLLECGEVCRLTAQFMISTSNFVHDLAHVCARVCDACFESCHQLDPDDPQLNACMVACRSCADSCRRLEH